MEVIFYTTHCPQCNILSKKLEAKNIQYSTVDNVETMLGLGLTTAPALSIDGGAPMNFKESVNWINTLEV